MASTNACPLLPLGHPSLPVPTAAPIDFSQTELSNAYSGFYATIVDDVFTASECAALIALAQTDENGWTPAGLSTAGSQGRNTPYGPSASSQGGNNTVSSDDGPQTTTVHSNFRNSERILRIDEEIADQIFARLAPVVRHDIGLIEPHVKWGAVTGKAGRKLSPVWKLSGVNPRLSFLRYGPFQYFKPHCDGLNESMDGHQKSFVTLHVYLNTEADGPLRGGATRFWTPNKSKWLDVVPRTGRVLIFQQRMLVHSGEEVLQGVKYTMRTDFMFETVPK